MTDQFTVDATEYNRRSKRRYIGKLDRALTGPLRTQADRWTPEEDAVVLRDDILLVEKIAILKRTAHSVLTRQFIIHTARPAVCEQCGTEYISKMKGRGQKYCSTACNGMRLRKSRTYSCISCETEFTPERKEQKFCSPQCGYKARRTLIEQGCAQCGTKFRPRSTGQKYCSHHCYSAATVVGRTVTCDGCGTEFATKRYRAKPSRYCSAGCYHKSRRTKKGGTA